MGASRKQRSAPDGEAFVNIVGVRPSISQYRALGPDIAGKRFMERLYDIQIDRIHRLPANSHGRFNDGFSETSS